MPQGCAVGCVADCANADQLEGMRQQIERQFGVVNLLFAFAGGDGNPEPIEQLTEERWDAVIAGNLKSKFLTVKSFLPGMKQQGAGSIVLMCSAAGRAPSHASLAYSSAQAGVAMLTRNLAQQVGKSGVRVNAIAPSTIMNDKIRKFMPEDQMASAPAELISAAILSTASAWRPLITTLALLAARWRAVSAPTFEFRNWGLQLPHNWSTQSNGAAFGTD
jgi:NAD(P)-dependent dehydrogenase (short-subunit alcohol dehydrogenase family)